MENHAPFISKKFLKFRKKYLTSYIGVIIITLNPGTITDSERRSKQMRYAAISENMMMDMGMCQMCMRTLRYALNSEPISLPGK